MKRIGVVGAGAMGGGIAQVAALAGLEVLLYDVGAGQLEAGLGRIRSSLDRFVQRGKLSAADRDAALQRIHLTTALQGMANAEFVVEAAPESLALKRQVFGELDRECPAGVILATNTSSLSVTEIAAATSRPDRVVGMHFFNPVPLMKLVEVVSGARTSPGTARITMELACQWGKTPVQAKDTPGFIVNRVARPFPGEALRLLGENVATVRQIDRVAKLAAHFRMGPFELMDLVGMDVNYAVNRSVFEQFFFEPRFRPHPLQAQMVMANLLGRKTGAGWYRYESDQIVDGPAGSQYATAPAPCLEEVGDVCVLGDDGLGQLLQDAGYLLTENVGHAEVVVACEPEALEQVHLGYDSLVLVEASRLTVTEIAARIPRPERVVGFGGIPSVVERQLVEIAVGMRTAEAT
ncbi:MAG TPA: 3-hydroxyacyl-CoA dehydrogenase NAD-binding domain-containing protein [Symbiobacteriaceae bacterium]|nr:3-hydroxyacyl-CoA dehydrogenase NAD-binding domain-containing protein [Symbiobacteriaceae bacterium]